MRYYEQQTWNKTHLCQHWKATLELFPVVARMIVNTRYWKMLQCPWLFAWDKSEVSRECSMCLLYTCRTFGISQWRSVPEQGNKSCTVATLRMQKDTGRICLENVPYEYVTWLKSCSEKLNINAKIKSTPSLNNNAICHSTHAGFRIKILPW